MEIEAQNAVVPDVDDKLSTMKQIPCAKEKKQQVRKKRLSYIREQLEEQIHIKTRKQQSRVLHLVSLAILMTVSALNAYILVDIEDYSSLKIMVLLGVVTLGLILSIASNRLIASWEQIIKLYLLLDSVVPVIIAAIIACYTILKFASTGQWEQHAMGFIFPLWVVYLAGNFRVMIAHAAWSRFEVITSKIILIICAFVFFYVGFTYMNGRYKITQGFLVQVQSRFRDMVYLYVFGVVELFYEYYRRLSYFDQTEELRHEYELKDLCEEQKKNIIEAELKVIELQMLKEELITALQGDIAAIQSVSSSDKASNDSEN